MKAATSSRPRSIAPAATAASAATTARAPWRRRRKGGPARERETDERHHRDRGHADAARDAQQIRQPYGPKRRRGIERRNPRERDVEDPDAQQHAGHHAGAVPPSGGSRHAGRAGTQPGDEKAGAEHDAADCLREDERLWQVDEIQMEQSKAIEPERAEHRRHERAEHHFEHGEVGQIELAGELRRAAESTALEKPTEGESEEGGRQQCA
jgi:hypothetical protein